MAITINESAIEHEPLSAGVARKRLLTNARVAGTRIFLDRLELSRDAELELKISGDDLAWFQMLEGAAVLRHEGADVELGRSHIVFLPPGFSGTLCATSAAALLYGELPQARRFDAAFDAAALGLRVVDWMREPMLDSEHDARKRIYVVTPRLFGTRAIKGEIIIYPPGTQASNHHHEGAEHFMYVLQGRGTAYANETPIAVRKGDLIYYGERERHYLKSEGFEDMVFVEFFVPGDYKTVWVEDAPVCTWTPTGRSLGGETPVREIKGHRSGIATPVDV
jgi:mannose-6-phosphate isomerase-like protein (cupin superfamily)